MPEPNIGWKTIILTLGASAIAAGATLGATVITGHQQTRDLEKSVTAQAKSSDKAELRGVIDQAEIAIVRAKAAWLAVDRVRPIPQVGRPSRKVTSRAQERHAARIFEDRARALDIPLARLKTRLGDKHTLTQAYGVVVFGIGEAALCRRRHPYQALSNSATPGQDPYTEQAIQYFTATAATIVGATLDQPISTPTPSAKDLRDLRKDLGGIYGAPAMSFCP